MDKDTKASPPYTVTEEVGVTSVHQVTKWQGFKDSFKRSEAQAELENNSNLTDLEKAAFATSKAPLERSLKARHLQMIAIGGSIGTGLFIGSGGSLSGGGPAAVVIGFGLIGTMLFNTVHSLGELAVRFPVSGAFSTYSTRFLDPAWGFAMGWNYALQWLIVFPLELVAGSMTISYWSYDGSAAATVNPDAWVCLFYIMIVVINLFGAKGYGEAEFVFSIIKVIAVVGFIILGIVLVCGGGPQGGYIGAKYWYNPGAFSHGFKGVCSVFVNAAFAFSGTELVGLAAAESSNPRKDLPTACKQVFWRITLFYMISLTLVGLLVPYNDERLLGSSSVDITASPFVIAINNAGIKALPSIINVVILISVLSVGNSSVYGCSRTLAALADQGQAPKILGYIDRKGRPLVGIGITALFGLLCFLAGSDKHSEVFTWMLALSGLSSIFTWGSINLCHIRFRRAMNVQGRSLDELPFKAALGVWGSFYGFGLNVLILGFQFWTALFPTKDASAYNFFSVYLAAPIILAFYIPYKIYYRPSILRAKDIDLVTGVREVDLELLQQELAEEKAYIKSKGWYYRVYKFWC
ncbi:hypothetical protein DV113_000861 [Geotrichum candidum]|uniref:Similar to Saccharomyces cerevisiae YKR039W GAP1 General amino acid permease n=1 Tax=Geotrichum candidum TaxID=1173061 RepID=A0A0J9XD21_GEOCN|nr:hypothetical protein DV454_004597 [Geotrichum candidum]KAF7501135.1 hypothetical protein DV113_000861 [Geotrichum candidum]CDO55185.1 similar to Saccharomyces cerevisiae YKR039W GAP1 General amino acid permease [Geotrichum candidum]